MKYAQKYFQTEERKTKHRPQPLQQLNPILLDVKSQMKINQTKKYTLILCNKTSFVRRTRSELGGHFHVLSYQQ